jgi:hypothetical protein
MASDRRKPFQLLDEGSAEAQAGPTMLRIDFTDAEMAAKGLTIGFDTISCKWTIWKIGSSRRADCSADC